MRTRTFLPAATVGALLACGSVFGAPQVVSALGFDITWDSGTLGAGWTASLSGEPAQPQNAGTSYSPVLTFSNPGGGATDTWSGEFSVTITPRTYVSTLTDTFVADRDGLFAPGGNGLGELKKGHTYAVSLEYSLTGTLVKSVSSQGVNTLPVLAQVPAAYGYNALSVNAKAGAQSFANSAASLYLATGGDANSLAINATPPRLFVDQISIVHAGEGVLFNGHLYVAKETVDLSSANQHSVNPANWTDAGPYVPPPPFGGEVGLPVTLTVKSEVWTPTFLQPSGTVRHCATLDCMTAVNGQYLPQSFSIMLGEMSTGPDISLTDITITAVPEPGSGPMLAAGLGLLAAVARRKRSTSPVARS
jgi:hypothetical protein